MFITLPVNWLLNPLLYILNASQYQTTPLKVGLVLMGYPTARTTSGDVLAAFMANEYLCN